MPPTNTALQWRFCGAPTRPATCHRPKLHRHCTNTRGWRTVSSKLEEGVASLRRLCAGAISRTTRASAISRTTSAAWGPST
eukprot:12898894-Prorocentrum_lima.AAC.1